jgi:hypothetical protein
MIQIQRWNTKAFGLEVRVEPTLRNRMGIGYRADHATGTIALYHQTAIMSST